MTLLSSVFERRAKVEGPYRLSDDGAVTLFASSSNSHAGVVVTEETAITYTAVWACVKVIAESIASVPLILYRRLDEGDRRERASDEALYGLLHDFPNDEMTSMVWRETMLAHLLLWGNHYSYIERSGGGEIIRLTPIPPQYVTPERTNAPTSNGRREVIYRVTPGETESPTILRSSEVLHIPGLSFNGLKGLSVIAANREAIGLGMAADQFGGAFFGNSARPSGMLVSEAPLKKEARDRIKEQWNEAHQGTRNAQKTAVLDAALKWQPISINPNDAQFLETRKYQVEDVARVFRVPLVLVQSMEKTTSWGSGVEQLMIGFVTHTLRPWMVRIEQEIHRKCLNEEQRRSLYVEHLDAGLLRGDLKSRYDAYAVGRQWGWLSPNDVRRKENEDPIPGEQGDSYDMPANIAGTKPAGNDMDDPTDDDSRAALRSVFERLLGDEIERETNAVLAALTSRRTGEFLEWLDEYYAQKPEFLRSALAGTLPENRLLAWSEVYVAESRRLIDNAVRLAATTKIASREAIGFVLGGWKESRAQQAADTLFGLEVAHADRT